MSHKNHDYFLNALYQKLQRNKQINVAFDEIQYAKHNCFPMHYKINSQIFQVNLTIAKVLFQIYTTIIQYY
jgi:hypothetical protein